MMFLKSYEICVLLYLIVEAPTHGQGTLCLNAFKYVPGIESRIMLKYYTGSPYKKISYDFPLERAKDILDVIDTNKKFALYIHGFGEDAESDDVQTILKAYLKRSRDNIIIFDWSSLAFDNYFTVYCRVETMGKVGATMIDKLVRAGLDINKLHIIGHSLGAQIASFIGKCSKNEIPRITGLDPAAPGFYHKGAKHINSNDANFVDIIHTDGGIYGVLEPTGTVDFYANLGTRPQPGCPLISVPFTMEAACNHHRSWRFYAESVENEEAFLGVQCENYNDFINEKCIHNRQAYVGHTTPTDISGKYYFRTRSQSPFSPT